MATLIPNHIYPFRAEEHTDGWHKSGFNHQTVDVRVRRIPEGKGGQKEHVQVEIGVYETKGDSNRIYSMHAGLSLTLEQAEVLIQALQNPVSY